MGSSGTGWLRAEKSEIRDLEIDNPITTLLYSAVIATHGSSLSYKIKQDMFNMLMMLLVQVRWPIIYGSNPMLESLASRLTR